MSNYYIRHKDKKKFPALANDLQNSLVEAVGEVLDSSEFLGRRPTSRICRAYDVGASETAWALAVCPDCGEVLRSSVINGIEGHACETRTNAKKLVYAVAHAMIETVPCGADIARHEWTDEDKEKAGMLLIHPNQELGYYILPSGALVQLVFDCVEGTRHFRIPLFHRQIHLWNVAPYLVSANLDVVAPLTKARRLAETRYLKASSIAYYALDLTQEQDDGLDAALAACKTAEQALAKATRLVTKQEGNG